ncbi:endoplasmic reticulum vesicle transporter-domain-containing protein, partial [Cladorrhinum sp. PSN259]
MMNGYDEKHPFRSPPEQQHNHNHNHRDLDDDTFGAKGSIVSAFDAFSKSKPQYVERTAGGGKWTVAMIFISVILFWSELSRWWRGTETHTFAVEKGVSHGMNINLDIVIKMQCKDLHINVQDASGDRILAAEALFRDPTNWGQWVDGKGVHKLGRDEHGRLITGEGYVSAGESHEEGFGEEHVHDIVALGRKKARWGKTPRLWGRQEDSCRIYGSLELNKVQGDFHITARGHGYMEFGEHLDHNSFNFSHVISELSFGPFLPSLVNPLDQTVNAAAATFYKFQYFLSVVPTTYSVGHPDQMGSRTIFTNQYAVSEQSGETTEQMVPGVFFKYDIEPILLNIVESRDSFFVFMIKVVNMLSGALVAGHWGYRLSDWIGEVWGKRRRSGHSQGMLGAKSH